MPSRNSFSIRKLFSSPRRLSHVIDEPASRSTVTLTARKSSISLDDKSKNDDNRHSQSSLHPDSSITTPQAERGLVDSVVHELSQDEIDRIKAVVAAAAAAAATSLRLRMQEEDIREEEESSTSTSTPAHHKSRRIPLPIVVPPRSSSRCCCRSGDEEKVKSESDIANDSNSDDLQGVSKHASNDVATLSSLSVLPTLPVLPSLSVGGCCGLDQMQAQAHPLLVVAGNSKSEANSNTSKGASGQREHSENENEPARRGRDGEIDENEKVDKEQKDDKDKIDKDIQNGNNSQSENDKNGSHDDDCTRNRRNNGQTAPAQRLPFFTCITPPHSPAAASVSDSLPESLSNTLSKSAKTAYIDSTLLSSFSSQPINSVISLPPLSPLSSLSPISSIYSLNYHQHHQHRSVSVFDPPPTLHRKKPDSRTSLPLPSALPNISSPLAANSLYCASSTTTPRLSSIFSARRKDAPEPAKLVTKSKSRTRLRSKKSKSLRNARALQPLRSQSASISALQSQSRTPRPQPEVQRQPQPQLSTEIDPESLIHPVYRGQYTKPDGKKDSGISLSKGQPSFILSSLEKETLCNPSANPDNDDSASEFSHSDSDSGSCLDLLQALAIQPEEVDQLHKSKLQAFTSAKPHPSTLTTMPLFDSIRNDIRIGKVDTTISSAVPAPRFDGATTPTFTRPRQAPSPAMPSLPLPLKSPALPMTPPYSPPATTKVISLPSPPLSLSASASASASASTSATKRQTRFLPALRLTKGGPSSVASVARKRSKKVSPRKLAALAQAASKKAPLPNGSHVDLGSNSASSSRWGLPDNVTELFNGRLFNRMEVTETLSFEKLQAIRESRAQAEIQKRERDLKEKMQREAKADEERQKREQQPGEELQQQQQRQMKEQEEAEQALLRELERPIPANPVSEKPAPALLPLKELSEDDDDQTKKRKNVIETQSSAKKTKKEDVEEVDDCEVSPLEPDASSLNGGPFSAHASQEQLNEITVSPTSPTSPPQSQRSSFNDSTSVHTSASTTPTAASLPPLSPLPPPPHIASLLVWDDDDMSDDSSPPPPPASNRRENVNTTLLLPDTVEPDGSVTPLEPFHMQDLPSRIDAASVRVSILLPVEEEEAYFASSVAEHKERRRRQREAEAAEAAVEAAAEANSEARAVESEPVVESSDKSEHAPSPPSKNPLRFSAQEHKSRAPPPAQLPLSKPQATIPKVTVTDVDNHGQHSVIFALPDPHPSKASRSPRSPRSPKSPRSPRSPYSPKRTKSGRVIRLRSSHSIPSSSIVTTPQRDEETYVYLPATPFSLVMPSFRHGPVRLLRPEQDSLFFSGKMGNISVTSPISPRRKHMAAVDDTLDWTAFQMAILGGAGDFFQDSVDFGRTSATEADEADSLSEWYLSMGIHQERLLTSEDEDNTPVARPAPQTLKKTYTKKDYKPAETPTAAPAPAQTNNYQHAHWASFGSTSDSNRNCQDYNARLSGQSNKSSSSSNSNQTAHTTQTAQSSQMGVSNKFVGNVGTFYGMQGSHIQTSNNLPVRFSGHFSIDAGSVGSTTSLVPPSAAPATSRIEMPASRTPSPSLYSRRNARPVEILGTEIPGELQGCTPETSPSKHSNHSNHRKNVASCASFDSYESMPQSPMADLVMTRGADGKEYVAPMGYNLGHDLGDFLRWETENVYAMGE